MKIQKAEWKKKYWLLGVAVLILAVIVAFSLILVPKIRIARAMDPSRYTNVKVVAWGQTVTVNDNDSGFTDENDDSYVPNLPDAQRLWTQIRDGDRYYCNGPYGEVYCTGEDKQELYFDFEKLSIISAWDLKKSGDTYVCEKNGHQIFCDFMNITNEKHYTNCTLEFQFDGDRIQNIRISYFYKLESYTVLEYSFEYTNETVALPTESLGETA